MLAEQSQGNLLIVDDNVANISVLFDFLTLYGFDIKVAEDGVEALRIMEDTELAVEQKPELILLDILMNNMNGFETCRRLKMNPETKDIPVIFMTSLADTDSKIKGFELGAVDYVTKPFSQDEVLARIRTHLTLRRLRKKLERQNEELDAFSRTVAHDLKNPLGALTGLTDDLLENDPSNLNERQLKNIDYIRQSTKKMSDIVSALLLLAGVSKTKVTLTPLAMGEIVEQVKERLKLNIEKTQAELFLPEIWPVAYGYAPWVEEVWTNYLSNAIKYGGMPPKLYLGAKLETHYVRFWVRDNGEGLSEASKSRLFTPFTRLNRSIERKQEGTGLGLSIVRAIVEKLGGQVGVESEEGQGSLFYFTLPVP
ncbi:sensor histidine kinase [Thioflexithrix psekupsensis]|uniref:histidine kinase n=1 Tax=Thioflexithrix psekupsensis TaxID=1570016 RepID=A0A251X526_9GAMM|nr:response regulator [Thioflexithrix psekupsensis]OUD12496.1 hybrid sensor histidine kinase/response regulator [Thioflexithrix psekupsensis]